MPELKGMANPLLCRRRMASSCTAWWRQCPRIVPVLEFRAMPGEISQVWLAMLVQQRRPIIIPRPTRCGGYRNGLLPCVRPSVTTWFTQKEYSVFLAILHHNRPIGGHNARHFGISKKFQMADCRLFLFKIFNIFVRHHLVPLEGIL